MEEDQRPISKVASSGPPIRLPRREIGRTAEYRKALFAKIRENENKCHSPSPYSAHPPRSRVFADGGREEAFLPFSLSFSTQQCLLLDLRGVGVGKNEWG